jgi:hypothetical protein
MYSFKEKIWTKQSKGVFPFRSFFLLRAEVTWRSELWYVLTSYPNILTIYSSTHTLTLHPWITVLRLSESWSWDCSALSSDNSTYSLTRKTLRVKGQQGAFKPKAQQRPMSLCTSMHSVQTWTRGCRVLENREGRTYCLSVLMWCWSQGVCRGQSSNIERQEMGWNWRRVSVQDTSSEVVWDFQFQGTTKQDVWRCM